MNSRSKILEELEKDKRPESLLPELPEPESTLPDAIEKFKTVLESIGGNAVLVNHWDEIDLYLNHRFSKGERRINCIPDLGAVTVFGQDPHGLENVALTILQGHFGVAENGAVWITDDFVGDRALPFICEHLAVVIQASDILPTLHEAYDRIGKSNYNFGTFIAGPSKTADIEQSLVLGAHGPKSMTVFLIGPA